VPEIVNKNILINRETCGLPRTQSRWGFQRGEAVALPPIERLLGRSRGLKARGRYILIPGVLYCLALMCWGQAQAAPKVPVKAFLRSLDQTKSLDAEARLFFSKGQYGKAALLFKRSLAINEKTLGPYHPDVATSLNDLADVYRAQGDYSVAEPLFKRALAIRENAFGSEHLAVGENLNSLGLLYKIQSMYDRAEPLYKRALAIVEKALGPDHPPCEHQSQ